MEFNEKWIEPLGYPEAAKYLYDMAKSEVFTEMDGYISGVFNAKKLGQWVGDEDVNGIVFWLCNTNSSRIPSLAIQKIKEIYQDNPAWLSALIPNRPSVHRKGLRIVKDLIKKNYTVNSSESDILNDIQNEDPITPQGFEFRDSRNVNEMRNHFRSNFSTHVNFPFAYYSTKYGKGTPYFKQFFEQGEVPYIRYYLGYATDEYFSGQRIRLILAPCKKDGSNLKDDECSTKHLEKFDGAMLLQYSWPPRPSETDQ